MPLVEGTRNVVEAVRAAGVRRFVGIATPSLRDPRDRRSVLGTLDALLDLVNYTPGTYDAALKDGARVASPTGAAGEGPGRTMVMAQPTTANLERVAQLLETGALRVPVQETYELVRVRRRSRRWPRPTPRESSPSAFPDTLKR